MSALSSHQTLSKPYRECTTTYRAVGPRHNVTVNYIPCRKATQLIDAQTKITPTSFVYDAKISLLDYTRGNFFQSFEILTTAQFSGLLKCITTKDDYTACAAD